MSSPPQPNPAPKSAPPAPPQKEGVSDSLQTWTRPADAPDLPDPPPRGETTPNGLPWGPAISDFFVVARVGGCDDERKPAGPVWSRSMIRALGEPCGDICGDDDEGERSPSRKLPWPVLKVLTECLDRDRSNESPSSNVGGSVCGDESGQDDVDEGPSDSDEDEWSPREDVEKFVACVGDAGVPALLPGQSAFLVEHFIGREVPNNFDPCTNAHTEADAGGGQCSEPSASGSLANSQHQLETHENTGFNATCEQATTLDAPAKPEDSRESSGNTVPAQLPVDDPTPANADAGVIAETTATTPSESGWSPVEKKGVPFQEMVSNHSHYCRPVHQCGFMPMNDSTSATNPPQSDSVSLLSQMVQKRHVWGSKRALDPDTCSNMADFKAVSSYTGTPTPKLEEFIPEEYMPEFLFVCDVNQVASCDTRPERYCWKKYSRLYPRPLPPPAQTDDDEPAAAPASTLEPGGSPPKPCKPITANLYLRAEDRIGSGNHASVFRAQLALPFPLSSRSRNGLVTVAAKIAAKNGKKHLNNEGKIYNKFKRHLQEDWSGFNMIEGLADRPVPVGAVVPKFYGYYVPESEDIPIQFEEFSGQDFIAIRMDQQANLNRMYSPILLLEECGKPIEPHILTTAQRLECYSLVMRLHHAHVLQNSIYVRNILVQPGPLTLPPEERSLETPRFRIIDFGRGKETGRMSEDEAKYEATREMREAKRELNCYFLTS